MAGAARARSATPTRLSADRRRSAARARQSTAGLPRIGQPVRQAIRVTRLPVLLARLAAAILPGASRDWGQAMIAETRSIARSDAAFRFALGCLRVAVGLRLSSLFMRQEPRMTLHPIVHP